MTWTKVCGMLWYVPLATTEEFQGNRLRFISRDKWYFTALQLSLKPGNTLVVGTLKSLVRGLLIIL